MLKRKSLEIAVHPDKSVVVKAPLGSTLEIIEEKIRKRARWIKRQIAYFEQFDLRTPARRYVGGESHLYLGREYRLKTELSEQDNVLLKDEYFFIKTTSIQPDHIKALMDLWYRKNAEIYLPKIFNKCWDDFNKGSLSKPDLKLQKMDKRWGNMSGSGKLMLNIRLILVPGECIEYVVVHELCHLIHYNHGPAFYKLLNRKMPDWTKRKHKLEMALI